MAIEFNVSKSCISPIVKWTVKVLVSNSNFSLPNRVDNIIDMSEDRIIDATETKIDRPIKHQEDWYSRKKKQHTIKK